MAELCQIYGSQAPFGKPAIIFVHGLGGDLRRTWMHRENADGDFWPLWLGEQTGCQVWLFGYEAAKSRWSGDSMALPNQANAFLDRLSAESMLHGRRLVLIGHSLGGLVIKKALMQAKSTGVDRYEMLLHRVVGTVFIGTPHFGSLLASICGKVPLYRANPQMSDLRLDNAELLTLNDSFVHHATINHFKVRVFLETQPVRLPWYLLGRILPSLMVVSPGSASLTISGATTVPVEANHIDIVKLKSRSSAIFLSLVQFVSEIPYVPFSVSADYTAPVVPYKSPKKVLGASTSPRSSKHIVLSTHCIVASEQSRAVHVTVCITTEDPELVVAMLGELNAAVQNDALIPLNERKKIRNDDLEELMCNPKMKSVALNKMAQVPFSAYVYYALIGSDINSPRTSNLNELLIVKPLFHRLSKKSEVFLQFHSDEASLNELIQLASEQVLSHYGRMPEMPKVGSPQFSALIKMGKLAAKAICGHLQNPTSCKDSDVFEALRTRIRYAENVLTGEKHLRDKNPLL